MLQKIFILNSCDEVKFKTDNKLHLMTSDDTSLYIHARESYQRVLLQYTLYMNQLEAQTGIR